MRAKGKPRRRLSSKSISETFQFELEQEVVITQHIAMATTFSNMSPNYNHQQGTIQRFVFTYNVL
ncbi:uncharacterized protein SPAPADRAFT_58067 [Spathaspora passalidarum NRRL Y-27907]|uniref:Uncharacterized protein n=1 Tax=Spathaspora passalidarum (strain NRRL Y-27907 / 11-Y1) TaxID=619300 RepID=G3AFF1_SPAPN|nr:uncharacterized protein SPAPADRAFT_58067 [Spathaspora passalidarum NRRL Y-27907]EGW34940.1 hypothetical protein SPAPADRAFT_58067 [Spathaspora passalidarum NRRL Y-27907]